MLSKSLRSNSSLRRLIKVRAFSSKIQEFSPGSVDKIPDSYLSAADRNQRSIDVGRQRVEKVKEFMQYMEYKKYPTHIGHWDPESPEHLESEIDDTIKHNEVNDYNRIIDELKSDLAYQEKIYQAIENMDRPYLQGKRGVTRNVYDKVESY